MAKKLENIWFKHDITAHNDPTLIGILQELDYYGIGLYWTMMELFNFTNGYITEKELTKIMWHEHMDESKVKKLFEIIGVEKNEKGYFYKGVLKRLEEREEYSKVQRDKANKRWNKNKIEAPVPEWYDNYEKDLKEKENKKKEDKKVKENPFKD